MTQAFTEKMLFEKIQMEIERLGSQSAFAEKLGVSRAYVNDLWWERRSPGSQRILDYFGLRKVYQPILFEDK